MSAAKLAANRTNAQMSTGPVTAEGKARSSANSLQHGLTSSQVVLAHESREEYEALRTKMLADLRPANTLEETLAVRIVDSYWKLQRCQRIEAAFLDLRMKDMQNAHPDVTDGDAALAMAFSDDAQMKKFRLFLRYLASAERAYYKAMSDLEKAQTARRKAEREQALAKSWAEAGPLQGVPGGFVSYTPETPVAAPFRSLPKPALKGLSQPQRHSIRLVGGL